MPAECAFPTTSDVLSIRSSISDESLAVRLSKAQVQARVHALPAVRFEEQRLTSFAGVVLIQALFQRLDLKARFARCFRNIRDRAAFGLHILFLQLVLHVMLGFRCLRDRDVYDNDPMICRVLGVQRLPDVSTLSRRLSVATTECVQAVRTECREGVLVRLADEALARVTLDFDGSVMSTRRHAEGTAIGFNRKRKGARSYYPLFCTVAQTGQFLDFHHRPGNVHDSNGAADFMHACVTAMRRGLPKAVIEARMDSAFFDGDLLGQLDGESVEFTASVPFERFPELKAIVEQTRLWSAIDDTWAFREISWAPKCWETRFRILLIRRKSLVQRKGPLQLDLFEPRDMEYEYKAIVTNKRCEAKAVLFFHNGRGSQEGLIGEAKVCTQLDYIPMRRRVGNQLFTAAAVLAHNLGREMQMSAKPRIHGTTPKRSALWDFETLSHLRQRLIQRAGRLTYPQGQLTLTMSANAAAQSDITEYLEALQRSG
jgi:hypothetical protein